MVAPNNGPTYTYSHIERSRIGRHFEMAVAGGFLAVAKPNTKKILRLVFYNHHLRN